MANKTYSIVINGLQESIKAVDALNSSLGELDKKIKALEGKAVKVGSTSSGGGSKSSSTGALSEEEKIQKQIEQLEEKRIAHSKEIYQNYLAAKDVLKEVDNDQKSIAATERLQAKSYSNTIQGMKQELADIKSAMQTVDLGDTDQLDKMVQRANQLNEALKKVEESYGQFGRNVGNYASAANGFKGLSIEVNGVTRSFDNAKQALMTLKKERDTLGVGMGRTSKEFKELDEVVKQLQSDIKDMATSSQSMDNLLDAMQSITAMASVGQGFASLFGIDASKIDESVKKLLALQNILKGIETISKQMQSKEFLGIGKYISVADKAYDNLTKKVLAANTAILGTGKAAQVAAVGITKLAAAFKVLLKATLIMAAISLVFEAFDKLLDKINEVSEAEKTQKQIEESMADAYGEGMAKLTQYKARLDSFNGSKKEEKKLVEELNKEFGSTLGTYKTIAEWQDVLNKKGQAYIKTLQLQAKAQAALNAVTAAYANLMKVQMGIANGEYSGFWNSIFGKSASAALAEAEKTVEQTSKILEETVKEQEKFNKDNKLGDFAPQIEKNGKKSADAAKKAQEEITSLQLRTMKDGLNKQLMQLDEEKRQTINKIKENGNRVGQQIKQVEEAYAQIRLNTIQDYLDKLNNAVNESANKLSNVRFSIDTKDIELDINEIEEKIKSMTDIDVVPINNTLTTNLEYGKANQDLLKFATDYDSQRGKARTEEELKEYFKWLEEIVSLFSKDVQDKLKTQNVLTGEMELDYNAAEKYIEEHYKKELNIVRSYGYQENASLSSSFEFRLNALRAYDADYIAEIDKALEAEINLQQDAAEKERDNLLKQNDEEYRIQYNALGERLVETENALKAIEKVTTDAGKQMTKEEKEKYDKLKNLHEETNKQIKENETQHGEKMQQIEREYQQKLIEIERSSQEKRQQNQQRYYDKQLSNYRDFLSKINSEAAKQPVTDKAGFGLVNIVQTKRNYKEILSAATTTLENIKKDRDKLNEDFRNGLIKPENYNATLNQLNDLENETKQTSQTVTNNLKNVNAAFVQSLQMYLQAALESFNTIMGAIWDAQEVAFDKEQEEIDKDNERLQNALDEKKDLISKYKSEIDSIEDELANSRGDRRQHLIDQLNAEMAAEREAAKQKKKIEEDQQRQQKKQDDLDLKRKKAEYHRNLTQAIVNGAMAVTMAAINSWPIPAIPMMALAGATTAAQIAIMAANKPYRVGGQLEGGLVRGKRHTQGGVPVGNTGIEVEGDEMIIRRESTLPNIDLLNYINKSQKKIDLDDMIDFYSSGKFKKHISSISPKTKFADGGQITLPSTIDVFDNKVLSAIDAYSNRPIYVTVTDIENRMEQVRYVRTLAGVGQE